METFSALLAICAGNSPVTGEFPTQRPCDVELWYLLRSALNKPLSKQWWGWWFETLSRPIWRHWFVWRQMRLWFGSMSSGTTMSTYSKCCVISTRICRASYYFTCIRSCLAYRENKRLISWNIHLRYSPYYFSERCVLKVKRLINALHLSL